MIRLRAGLALFCVNGTVRGFVEAVVEVSGKSYNRVLEELMGCLLVEEIPDVGRVYANPFRDELFECLIVDKLRGRLTQSGTFRVTESTTGRGGLAFIGGVR